MDDQVQSIRDNAHLGVGQLGPLSEIDFGFNRESVEWVDGYIERLRAHPDFDQDSLDGLVGVLGSFPGECVIAATGGVWQWSEEDHGWGVALADNTYAFPFAKVRKQFENGAIDGNSILGFYRIGVDYIALGKLPLADKPTRS